MLCAVCCGIYNMAAAKTFMFSELVLPIKVIRYRMFQKRVIFILAPKIILKVT